MTLTLKISIIFFIAKNLIDISNNMSNSKKTTVIGLTGGIASGKTAAATVFKDKLNLTVICADEISRGISKKRSVVRRIGKYFLELHNENVIINNQLNRAKIREIITHHRSAKIWLEEYLHPVIKRELKKQIALSETDYTVVDIPLLTPYNLKEYNYLTKIIVIKSDHDIRVERLMKRDKKTRQQAIAFIKLQISDIERDKIADYTIDNSNLTQEQLKEKLENILNHIKGID